MAVPLGIASNIFTILSPFLGVALERLVPDHYGGGQNQSISVDGKDKLDKALAAAELILDKVDYEHVLKYPHSIRCLKNGIYRVEGIFDDCGHSQVPSNHPLLDSLSDSMTDLEKILDHTNNICSQNFLDVPPYSYHGSKDSVKKHLGYLWPGHRYLQKCFLLASIFPRSYKFEKDNLIQLWIAEDFIRNDRVEKESLEDIGSKYLNELEERNIFSNSGDCYQIRDKVHELANSVCLGECLTINDGEAITDFKSCITSSLHHFSLLRLKRVANHDTVHEDLAICEHLVKGRCEGLRTFLLHIEGKSGGSHKFCFQRLVFFKHLRVLDISCSSINTVTDSISCLKNLRHLNLSKCRIKKLPSTIRKLKRLWILKLNGCKELKDLPYLGELDDLQHLLLDKNHHLDSLPPGIGQLIMLETFSCPFVVGRGKGEKIGVLKEMNNLRGSLCISNLENVLSLQEASEAALDKKQFLQKLKFKWNEEGDYQVLVKLLPSVNLEILKLSGYGGKLFPDWMANPSLLPNLRKVSLSNCTGCEALPAFWRLESLKSLSLSVSGTDLAKTLNIDFGGIVFKSLEILKLKNMPDMTCWVVEQAGGIDRCPFPQLNQLIFKDCPKLRDLEVHKNHVDHVWRLPFPKLNQLTIQDCPELTELEFLQFLNSDCHLKVKECPSLGWVGQHPDWQTEEQEDGSFIYSRLRPLEVQKFAGEIAVSN